jgi:hypothetical protein
MAAPSGETRAPRARSVAPDDDAERTTTDPEGPGVASATGVALDKVTKLTAGVQRLESGKDRPLEFLAIDMSDPKQKAMFKRLINTKVGDGPKVCMEHFSDKDIAGMTWPELCILYAFLKGHKKTLDFWPALRTRYTAKLNELRTKADAKGKG